MKHNQSTEDYIKGIYKLQQDGGTVSTSELAAHLEITDASVTDMVKKLSERKLLWHTPYRGVELTEQGKRLALKMMRRHRLWEMLLVKFLGYSWDEVHDEAELLEHVTSDEMEQRLDKALGYPKVDPHGDPIPTAEGILEVKELRKLSDSSTGDRVAIARVNDDDSALLQHASRLGLELNAKLRVEEKLDFDGSMTVKVGNKKKFISKKLAEAVFVTKA
ncbi:MAG TPA: metal-dependent transcriptional regulator [Bacteroidota bacterium]|nr:metal-dependent transcriptional regulator [Bacteroidota bacterium]